MLPSPPAATNLQRPFGPPSCSRFRPPAPYPRRSEEEEDQDDIHTPVKIRPEDEAPDSPLGPPPTPFSPSGRQSVFYSKLTTHEHQRLREFRALLNKSAREDPTLLSTPALKRFANDATLCRYLRARDWNLKRAMKMLKCVPGRTPLAPDEPKFHNRDDRKTKKKPNPSLTARPRSIHPSIHPSRASLQWRKAARPEFITWDDVKKEGEEGKQYLSGRDRHGRAVLIARPGRDGGREQASHVRFLIYTLEHATWSDTAEDDLPLGAHAEHTSEKLDDLRCSCRTIQYVIDNVLRQAVYLFLGLIVAQRH